MQPKLVFSATLCALLAGTLLSGCGVAVVGGAAATGGMVATDRRSPDTQLDDKLIDVKAAERVHDAIADRGHVVATSYYRKVLITGQVPTEEDRQRVQAAVQGTPGVEGVINELTVAPAATLAESSADTLTTARVKTGLFSADGVPANSIKVVTELGTTYLMGRLTRRETDVATEVARTTPGVQRVVRVIDFISEQAALHPSDPTGVSPPPAPVTSASETPLPAATAQPVGSGVGTQPVTQSPTILQPPVEVTPLPPVK